jgi:hypothetical protein
MHFRTYVPSDARAGPRRSPGRCAGGGSRESGTHPRGVDVWASRSHATFFRHLQSQNPLRRKGVWRNSPNFYPLAREKILN